MKLKVVLFLIVIFNLSMQSQNFKSELNAPPFPWTDIPIFQKDDFRFVVIGDLTGGEEQGLFATAIDRINDLSPDFVISVGDLIDGYTNNESLIEKQWDSFNRRLAKLESPFFYVSGNHDVGNKVLSENWTKRYGKSYYSFKINKTLFLILNTSEPGERAFSQAQVDFIKITLLNHPPEDPLLVFSHDPLFKLFKKKEFKEIEELFVTRNAHFFCGHEHRYLYKKYKDQTHYMLAGLATGDKESIQLGHYHNLLFVTQKSDINSSNLMKVANIKMEGLLPVDIVNNNNLKQVDILRSQSWAYAKPSFLNNMNSKNVPLVLTIENPGDYSLQVKSDDWENNFYQIYPEAINLNISSGDKKDIALNVLFDNSVNIDSLSFIDIPIHGLFKQQPDSIGGFMKVRCLIDCYRNISIDSSINRYQIIRPSEIQESWDWSGDKDCSLSYSVVKNNDSIYLSVQVKDDCFIKPQENEMIHDKLSLFVSTNGQSKYLNYLICEFMPGGTPVFNSKGGATSKIENIRCDHNFIENIYTATMIIPITEFDKDIFRFNFSYQDSDDYTNLEPSVLWWKPNWSKSNNNTGCFILN